MRWPFLAGLLSLLVSAALAQPSATSTPAGLQAILPGPVTLGNGPSLDLNFVDGSTFDPRITYTGSGGTSFNAAGAIVAATTNVPRIDYDPVTHAVRGLLLEEARTNLLLNSATLSTQSVTTTAVAYTLSFYSTGSAVLSGSCAGSPAGTGAFPARVALTFTATAGTCTVTVTGSVLNAQLEAGSFPTSWISTAGASAARAVDLATMPVAAWFNATAMTLAADAMLPAPASAQQGLVVIDDGTANNRIILRNSTGFASVAEVVATATTVNISGGVLAASIPFKTATAINASGASICLNGGAVTNGAAAMPAGLTTFRIGQNAVGIGFTNGYIRRIRYWPRALSSIELQVATT